MNARADETLLLLQEMSTGYQKSKIILSSAALGIFETLSKGALTAEAIGLRTGTNPRALRVVLDALAGLGLLEKTGPAYSLSESAADYLLPGHPFYMGDILRHHENVSYAWNTLTTVMKYGARVPREQVQRPYSPGEQLRFFIQGMKNLETQLAPFLLEKLDLTGRRRMLDLGGGPGWHSVTLGRRYGDLAIVVYDLPEAVHIGLENIQAEGMDMQIRFQAGDFLVNDIGQGFDVVLLANILHIFPESETRALLAKCAKALQPGGLLAVVDFFVDEKRTGPLHNLLFAVHMLVNSDGGDVYTPATVKNWMKEAGLEPADAPVSLDGKSSLLLAHKPE